MTSCKIVPHLQGAGPVYPVAFITQNTVVNYSNSSRMSMSMISDTAGKVIMFISALFWQFLLRYVNIADKTVVPGGINNEWRYPIL
jgi:hypothetical protein